MKKRIFLAVSLLSATIAAAFSGAAFAANPMLKGRLCWAGRAWPIEPGPWLSAYAAGRVLARLPPSPRQGQDRVAKAKTKGLP